MTLIVARLYIEPTLKGESGPTGDPVVSDSLHLSGMYLSWNRTLTQLGGTDGLVHRELSCPSVSVDRWPTGCPIDPSSRQVPKS